ncbi:MAG: hypothetical protein AB7I50_19650 [Vicinamibacterales bacterium]
MTDDEVFARWQERFDRILTELTYVFENRRKFRDIQTMFQTNERLIKIGSQPWEWMLGHWGRDTVMAIRRELDDNRNTISLGAILDEMAERPTVLTRRRYFSFAPVSADVERVLNEQFDRYGIVSPTADRMDDHIAPAGIQADRMAMMDAAGEVLEYANRLIAHRTPINEMPMTVGDVTRAIDAMEPVVKKYFVILTGNTLLGIEPTNMGDDWKEVFTFPWYEPRVEALGNGPPFAGVVADRKASVAEGARRFFGNWSAACTLGR